VVATLNSLKDPTGDSAMLDSCVSVDLRQPLNIIDDHFLSAITTLFIDEMAMNRNSLPPLNNWHHLDHPWQLRKNKAIPTFPCSGIWGNLSLISLASDKSGIVFQRVSELEHMIQNGSVLINAVFGYLGERRMVAKTIRLNQLIQEINGILPTNGDRIKNEILQANLATPTAQNSVVTLASNLSRILRQFVEHLQFQYNSIISEENLTRKVSTRLCIVDGLMAKALELPGLLDRYAGSEPLDIKKMSAKTMIAGLSRKFKAKYPQLKISHDMARRLPWIHVDRSGMQFVLNQLMENAAFAMSGRGKLHIEANPLKADPARNRCVAHRWSGSIVITVSDNGCGMDLDTLLHLFDPFFTGGRKSRRLGMGMAAAWGIVKAHGGYMHVRSKLGKGSCCKLYLPVEH
jgi:signal transduction histidine kinase